MITITFSSNKFIHKLFSFYRSIFAFFVPQFPSPDSANQEAEIKDQKSLIGFFPNIKCLYLWARGFLKRYLKLVGARWLASAFRVICINPYQHSPPTAGSPVEGLDDHLVIVLFNFTDKLRLLRGMSACFAIESTSPDSVHKEEEEVLKDLKSLKELPLLLNIASLDSWTRELTREF
ncbi:MAG: hypothetical protein HGA53_04750, partial [Anaerolineaceae bacterium]|nr:hypothetical protein [Anaerolineaceae bacterium]